MNKLEAERKRVKDLVLKTNPVGVLAMMVQEPDFDPERLKKQARASLEMFMRIEKRLREC